MAHWTDALAVEILRAGGEFVRWTGHGHRRYKLNGEFIDLPSIHGSENPRLRRNIEAQVRRVRRGESRMPRKI